MPGSAWSGSRTSARAAPRRSWLPRWRSGRCAALVLGPALSWSIALPSEEGLPAVFDAALPRPRRRAAEAAARTAKAATVTLAESVLPWASVLAPEGGWLVAALAVAALEPLATFHERVSPAREGAGDEPRTAPARPRGRPAGATPASTAWRSPASVEKALAAWDRRLGVAPPPLFS